MTHRPDVACSRELAARWCALAERRLDHLTELFQSGRWRRYYTEQSLLDDIRHAKAAVQAWKALSVEPEAVSIVPSQTPSVVAAVPPAPTRPAVSETIAYRPIELPRSLETILAESEIIVQAEIELAGDDLEPDYVIEPDYVVEEDIAPEPTAAAPRIDMAALEQALSIGIGHEVEDHEPMVDLDAIERRYPALAHAY
ncbi:TIGR03809 family protein [Bradyrhizobium ontarionense]|uniref:TIGR03809 family protein n=1 Tax=Bradyrhizobium ontarionense TaxID=2898149 RepID=A0ABY3RIX0_9BRAD|nr:TIGR03809 family protein [Bradyrhizobium sp. A19]UFZ06791.1 TIGR03809 family protein [Bradyrhizobium sp. A19]